MIKPEQITGFKKRVKEGIRDKNKPGTIKKSDVADRFDELVDLVAGVDSGDTSVNFLKIYAQDFIEGWIYNNPYLLLAQYSLDIKGGAPLVQDKHYVRLPTGGFQLINGVTLGPTDYIILYLSGVLTGPPVTPQPPAPTPDPTYYIKVTQPEFDGNRIYFNPAIDKQNLVVIVPGNINQYLIEDRHYVMLPGGGLQLLDSFQFAPGEFMLIYIVDGVIIPKIAQLISFASIPQMMVGQRFPLAAVATSGLEVSFISSDPSIAKIEGQELVAVSVGSVNIVASQIGNNKYMPALDEVRRLTVIKVPTPDPVEDNNVQFPFTLNYTFTQ